VAEDGPENQRLISLLLRRAGATVVIAENGRVALDMLMHASFNGEPFDLLVTDMQMPEMDGYTLVQTLRMQGNTMPILAVTANTMTEDERKCRAAGCDAFVSKPIDKASLIHACAELLQHTASVC
jgi:CheY-like chemotaxis protein